MRLRSGVDAHIRIEERAHEGREATDRETGGQARRGRAFFKKMSGCWFYILRCADGSYYVGTTRQEDLETRVSQHNQGLFGGYTAKRCPVALVYSAYFERIVDVIAYERQVKGWSRAKKEALVCGDFGLLQALSKRHASPQSS